MPRTNRKVTAKDRNTMVRVSRVLGGQKNTAKFFGVAQSSVSRYISGTTPVPKSVILAAENVLKQSAGR